MFKSGQTVRIRPWSEIKKSLINPDNEGYTWDSIDDEVSFVIDMKKFCGTTQVIELVEEDNGYQFFTLEADNQEYWWVEYWIDKIELLPEELFTL
jgi:hypothetical protein